MSPYVSIKNPVVDWYLCTAVSMAVCMRWDFGLLWEMDGDVKNHLIHFPSELLQHSLLALIRKLCTEKVNPQNRTPVKLVRIRYLWYPSPRHDVMRGTWFRRDGISPLRCTTSSHVRPRFVSTRDLDWKGIEWSGKWGGGWYIYGTSIAWKRCWRDGLGLGRVWTHQ